VRTNARFGVCSVWKTLQQFCKGSMVAPMELPWTREQRRANAELREATRELLEATRLGQSSDSSRGRLPDDIAALDLRLTAHEATIAELQATVAQLRIALSDGIEHEERRERRIQATVRRARKELQESGLAHDGLQAEFDGLSVIDGDGGVDDEVSPLHGEVEASSGGEESSVPGVTIEQLQRARGMIS